MPTLTKRRTVLLGCLVSGVAVVLCLLITELVFRMLPVSTGLMTLPVNASTPVLHYQPDRSFVFSRGWNLREPNRGRVNNAGWVSDETYDSASTTPLLAVIGDSYVEAEMVPFGQTMQGRLAVAAKPRARVYSFGVSGAPLSQYLAEAEYAARTFRPMAIAFVIVGNDFDESLLAYKTIPGQHYFEDSSGTLVLRRTDFAPGRLRGVVRRSALARYLFLNLKVSQITAARATRVAGGGNAFIGNTAAAADSGRIADSKRAVDAFLDQAPARARLSPSQIVLVVDAIRSAIYSAEGARAARGSYYQIMRDYFIAEAGKRGYEVIDMAPRFAARYAREHLPFEFADDAHWNARGHDEASRAVAESAVFRRLISASDTTSATRSSPASR